MNKKITFRIDDKLVKRYKIHAAKNDTSITALVHEALNDFADKRKMDKLT